ncbi:MAG: N-acyl homoserine lactonase family protein, partial [Anaerolineae bacterium]
VVQRSHYDDAQNNPRFEATRAIWNQDPDRFIFVEGDHELVPGFTLVETTGHTVGHQSVLLTLPQTGGVLLTIDAVDSEANFSMDRDVSPMNEDEEAVRASTAKLLDIASQDEVALVIFGHDPQQWESLKKLPDYYA